MKREVYFLYFALVYFFSLRAQRTEFMFGVQGGLNRICLGVAPGAQKNGYSHAFYLSLTYKGPKSLFRFNPSVAFVTNSYQARVNRDMYLTFPQAAWRLTLQTGINITKHLIVKGGFFMQVGMNNAKYRVYVTTRQGPQYYSAGYEELYDAYMPVRLQAGAQLGLMLTVGNKERFGFELQLQQLANPVSESDYYLIKKLEQGDDKLLLSKNAKPTVLALGISYRIISRNTKYNEPGEPENMRY